MGKIVISKVQGGAGNQIFQWAAARAYAEKYNTEYYFDVSFYKYQDIRKLQLGEFKNITLNIMEGSVENYGQMTSKFTPPFSVNSVRDTFNYEDDVCNFLPSNNEPYDILVLNGYWQSEKYFKEFEGIIRKELMLDFNLDVPYLKNNTVSMHIRRSDYLNSNGYHPVQNMSYYENAIDYISDYDHILVFSDDIQWCKDNLKFKNMIFMENFSDIQDMYIMSQCTNNIIANSSFSWWGAWLNENKNKKVIAPNKWFGDHVNINQSDIVPENWIKI